MMEHKIINTGDYLLIVDDSEIKKETYCYDSINNILVFYKGSMKNIGFQKVICHLPLNNSPILEGVDLLPPLKDEPKGFNEYEYTEEDLIEYSNWLFRWCEYNKYRKVVDGVKPYGLGEFISDKDMFNKFLKEKSLQQPKLPIAFECEMQKVWVRNTDRNVPTLDDFDSVVETDINSEGQTVWVGEYIYN